jgi:SAM-dependent methyltransferase
MKRFLHVGCGHATKPKTTPVFAGPDWQEVRLDIDPDVKPDIVASITDLSVVDSGSMDAIFSSHNVEHLFEHEVPIAFGEFRRVLKPDGYVVITCPDLKSVARLIAEDKLDEPAYVSAAGPITPHDILYGHGASIRDGRIYMAHRGGFTAKSLYRTLAQAGFGTVATVDLKQRYELWAVGMVAGGARDGVVELLKQHAAHRGRPVVGSPSGQGQTTA